jgi:hypothetical protein
VISERRFGAACRLNQLKSIFVVILSTAFLMECGCTTARVRWTGKRHEPTGTAVVQEKPVEPSMAANVALKTDETAETESAGTSPSPTRTPSASLRLGSRFLRTEGKISDNSFANATGTASDHADSETLVDAEKSTSSLERLNAALSDDANLSHALPQKSLTTLDARVRIDSLLARAKQLFDVGQFDQARQTALTAQELCEDSQIDFLPDEDRPIDLIRRIEGQQKATQNPSDSDIDRDPSETTQVSHQSGAAKQASKAEKPSHTPEKDSSGLTRIRRDWSTLFRREKKAVPHDAKAIAAETKPAQTSVAADARGHDLQASHHVTADASDAIVMANRSVSLVGPESTSSPPAAFENTEAVGPDSDTGRANLPGEVSSMLDTADSVIGNPLINASSRLATSAAESPMIQPEFDIVEAVVPFREVNSAVDEEPRAEPVEDDDARRVDWTYLYIIFGICSMLALACYRRGAT